MSQLIENYRGKRAPQPAAKAARPWPYVYAALAVVFTVGLVALSLALSTIIPIERIATQPTLLRSSATAADYGDASITGSSTAMTTLQSLLPTPDDQNWTVIAYVLGVSGLAGALVFLAMSFIFPSRTNVEAQSPQDRNPAARKLADAADERRWHGGPIRN